MRKQRKTGITAIRRPFVVKGLTVLFLICVLIRAAAAIGSDSLAEGLVSKFIQNDGVADGILGFELGYTKDSGFPAFISSMFVENPSNTGDEEESGLDEPAKTPDDREETVDLPEPELGEDSGRAGLFYGDAPSQPSAAPPVADIKQEIAEKRSADGIVIDNTTQYEIDVQALLDEPLNIELTAGSPSVLIIHTHTSEAYTQAGGDEYEESDPFRTEDKTKNIVRVGDELTAKLEERGIGVVHDRRSYDYPSYTGSYSRSYSSIQSYLKKYPSIKLVIDLHRDAITAADGSQYKTIAQIGEETCSQVMMVVGSDAAGLEHPTWRENLKLALYLQQEMNVLSPTLARPVRISQYRYNQQATKGSLIVEIGCAGNTLSESLTAARCFADAAANVILGLYT